MLRQALFCLRLFLNQLCGDALNNWHAYLNLFAQAGYINGDFVAATNAVVYCYVMYLIGKYEYKVKIADLNKIIDYYQMDLYDDGHLPLLWFH